MSRRAYDATGRRSAAARTQARVVAVATGLMVERGYAGTTVADVATAAEVSPALVYAAFGNKAGLLKRVIDAAIAGDDDPVSVAERPQAAAVVAAGSARVRCRLTAELVAGIQQRTAPLVAVAQAAAGTDPEVAQFVRRADLGRRAGMSEFVAVLGSAGHLRDGLDADRAADLAWVLTAPQTYLRLVEDRGWTREEYSAWLAAALHHDLCARTP